MPLLFVYGTLKRGYGNNHLLSKARLVSDAISFDESYIMWGRGFPLLVEGQNEGHAVKGEIYYVDDETLADCDRLEGHPDWYCREMRSFNRTDKDGRPKDGVVSAWVYLQPKKLAASVPVRRVPVEVNGQKVLEWHRD